MAKGTGSTTCTVVLHDDTVSKEHALCGVKYLPSGGVAWLSAPHTKRLCIVSKDSTSADEISIHVSVGRKFGFENRMRATLEIVENKVAATATHVELFFRDQHLSRADMWRMEADLDTTALYTGQRLGYLGSTVATVDSIYHEGKLVDSACIWHPRTKLIFRSGSARYILLIQVSKEMLEYWSDGDLLYERLLDGFLPDLFRRWKDVNTRHQITVVLFGRRLSRLNHGGDDASKDDSTQPLDFIDVVAADISSADPEIIVKNLKRAFNGYKMPRDVCLAAKGNMLEAISIAAMEFVNDNVDPHLATTGSAIIAVTAGAGVFETEHELLRKTTRLLMGNSVGVDIVALSPKPYYPVPLFQYVKDGVTEYALPHWADISYWPSADDNGQPKWLLPGAVPAIEDVYLPPVHLPSSTTIPDSLDAWDEQVFGTAATSSPVSATPKDWSFKKIPEFANSDSSTAASDEAPSLKSNSRPTSPVAARPPSSYAGSVSSLRRPKRTSAAPHPLMQMGRTISVGPKGLALGSGVASTSVSTQHAEHGRENAKIAVGAEKDNASGIARQIRASLQRESAQPVVPPAELPQSSQSSKPKEIPATEEHASKSPADLASAIEKRVLNGSGSGNALDEGTFSATPRPQGMLALPPIDPEEEYRAAMSPWLTLLNPCHPREGNMRVASEYRQWQNVFPQAVGPDTFRWESMCTPAVLPLLRESRMSQRHLDKYFEKDVRRMATTNDAAHAALRQMISLRLSAGFQIVPTKVLKETQMSSRRIDKMLLSLGDQYQMLECLSDMEVEVRAYHRELPDLVSPVSSDYRAMLRPAAGFRQHLAHCTLADSNADDTQWSALDDQCVHVGQTIGDLGNFQMRLVLVPVAFGHTDTLNDPDAIELADAEKRIDGIQKLTQLWQRNRYFTVEEQQHHASLSRARSRVHDDKDLDPLSIEYQTKDPSAVVATFGGGLDGHSTSNAAHTLLFPKSDTYHTSTFDISKLLKHMQEPPPVGVEMKDRRWLTRFHIKCFRGDEMTTWLLSVFKNLDTRTDAVEIGNELLRKDIFTHVRGKHEFRDGNYFYQIKSAYRTTAYPDTTGLFAKGIGRSVPSTPISEMRQSPSVRAMQGDSDSSGKGSPTPVLAPFGSPQSSTVMLSHKLQYNMDASKRSGHFELVNLHYDRIHNPDNCYHIQLDWTTTTPKLIRESVSRWASLVERYGLKLVQLPVKEGSKFHIQHPLEQRIYVKMAASPAEKAPETPHLDPQSASPRTAGEDAVHHKLVLRKMDFVLDLESARSFPRRLKVEYSWGAPEYEYTQFIHRSGVLLAQITNDGASDFVLMRNPLASQWGSSSSKNMDSSTSRDIVRRFVGFCGDVAALKEVWEKVRPGKGAMFSPLVKEPWTVDEDVPPIELPPHLIHRSQRS